MTNKSRLVIGIGLVRVVIKGNEGLRGEIGVFRPNGVAIIKLLPCSRGKKIASVVISRITAKTMESLCTWAGWVALLDRRAYLASA